MAHTRITTTPQTDSNTEKELLPTLPTALLEHCLFGYLTLANRAALSKNARFKQIKIYQKAPYQFELLLSLFLKHVVRSDIRNAEEMLIENPELLLVSGQLKDHAERLLEGTALQIALGADDLKMIDMLVFYFDQLAEGQDEKCRQYQALEQAEEKEDLPSADLRALDDITALIATSTETNEERNQELKSALARFRKHFSPPKNPIRGTHFNALLIPETFKRYINNYSHWTDAQNELFFNKVCGYLQRLLPAHYLLDLYDGFYDRNRPNFKIKNKRDDASLLKEIFPLDKDPNDRLGYNYAKLFPLTQNLLLFFDRNIGEKAPCRISKADLSNWITHVEELKQRCIALASKPTTEKDLGL